jgi:FAD/FMN-containing dehydrogenase
MGAYHDDNRRFEHPGSADEVCDLVKRAVAEGKNIRVAGAQHSEDGAIHANDGGIDVMIDQMRALEEAEDAEDGRKRLWVGAGCNLGKDPWDQSGTSKWNNGLNHQLEEACLALEAMGGISHQTIAGFLLTGSSGGSVTHSAQQNIVAIEYVNGRGETNIAKRGDEMFDALGVSMGLLGIVTRVQLEVGENYDLEGAEETMPATDTSVIDFFGPGDDDTPSLSEWLKSEEYSRVLWWPQYDFDRMQLWHAKRAPRDPSKHQPFSILTPWDAAAGSFLMTVLGHRHRLNEVYPKLNAIKFDDQFRAAHDDVKDVDRNACLDPRLGSEGQMVAAACQQLGNAMARVDRTQWHKSTPDWKAKLMGKALFGIMRPIIKRGPEFLRRWLGRILDKSLPHLIDEIVSQFVSDEAKHFRDSWMCALPMDNQMDDQLWGTRFTELWIPFEHADAALGEMRDHFRAGDDKRLAYERTGPYAYEVYASSASNFWLSPGYQEPRLRFNPFWFELWGDGAREHMEPFWKMFEKYDFRPHWGKLVPQGGDWPAYWRRQFPKLDDFLELRKELDPDDIFLNDYWRKNFGI